MSLYGITNADECIAKFEEFRELSQIAREKNNKELIRRLKTMLGRAFRLGDTKRGFVKMSSIEKAVFFPCVHKCWADAPNLNDKTTWESGLYSIEDRLDSCISELKRTAAGP